ncbi:hypothetical protein BJ508DRAFT_86581 [Ascobolus immersus RN42]|uniref:Uncharacterized protein n=1 Tax=Ascobolus immersus RN42 TaxID=1160509 RepID=A0A3N4I970_ASCIM|nr:hypothetical protein BJ508DRAFT_86581 [Ascobolus immersus RN42]
MTLLFFSYFLVFFTPFPLSSFFCAFTSMPLPPPSALFLFVCFFLSLMCKMGCGFTLQKTGACNDVVFTLAVLFLWLSPLYQFSSYDNGSLLSFSCSNVESWCFGNINQRNWFICKITGVVKGSSLLASITFTSAKSL